MTEVKVADLSQADEAILPGDTAVLHIVFPGTNKRTGWDITVAGPGHPQTVALSDKWSRENLKKRADIERAQVNGKKWKGDEDLDPAEQRRETITNVVSRIVSWTPVNFGQGAIDFNEGDTAARKRAVELFMDPKMGAYFGQLVDFITEENSFFKRSATS